MASSGARMRAEWEEIEGRRQRFADSSKWTFGLGALVALTFVAWTQYLGEPRDPAIIGPALEATVIESPVIEVPRVLEESAPNIPQSDPARTGRESYVGVFECVVNGPCVVSDRPCAPDAEARTLVIDQPDPREVAAQRQQQRQAQQPAARAYSGSAVAGGRTLSDSAEPSNLAACEAVDRAIEHLHARMRQRYTSAEGEWLRSEWHALRQQRYELRCGR